MGFLVTSMIAMVQMEFILVLESTDACWKQAIPILVGWMLVVFLCRESFITASYFHTTQAVWIAWLCGTIIFGGVVVWWWKVIRDGLADSNKVAAREVVDGPIGNYEKLPSSSGG